MYVEINGLNINYTDYGSGKTILLLHGWGSSLEVWNRISEFYKANGNYRIVALDFPGCGKSPLPEKALVLDDYTNLVIGFCRYLKIENPIIFGHSNGGRVALSLLGQGLITAEKVVLFGSAGIKAKASPKKVLKIKAFKTAKFFLTLPFIKNYTEDLLNKTRAFFGSSDYNNAPEVMRKTLVSLVNSDISELLPNITVPTLLIWGSNDTAVPLSDAKKMEKLIPDAGLCVLEGCGHFAFIEKPYDVEMILKSFIN